VAGQALATGVIEAGRKLPSSIIFLFVFLGLLLIDMGVTGVGGLKLGEKTSPASGGGSGGTSGAG
jgi:hypothetical protein